MEVRLWTVHRKGAQDLRLVDDRFSVFALILPPVWAIWNSCWVTLGVILLTPVLVALISPLAISPAMYGLGFILALEGGQIRRWELRLRGWREAGVVEAGSEEGAEEQWITGQAA